MHSPAQSYDQDFATVGLFLNEIAKRFDTAGIETSRLDARVLISHVLRTEPSQLFTRSNDPIDFASKEKICALVERRLAKEPVSRIIGKRDFWGLTFELNADILDPRPDTETVVAAVLQLKTEFGDRPVRILDLGTGSGCILLALLHEWPAATGTGADISVGAVAAATSNARNLRLDDRATFVVSDWAECINKEFDIVVCNPPYIAENDRRALPEDVERYDPSIALFGGPDGLSAYRDLISAVRRVVKPNGFLALELGATQADAVGKMLPPAGFKSYKCHRDLAGVERCIVGRAV